MTKFLHGVSEEQVTTERSIGREVLERTVLERVRRRSKQSERFVRQRSDELTVFPRLQFFYGG